MWEWSAPTAFLLACALSWAFLGELFMHDWKKAEGRVVSIELRTFDAGQTTPHGGDAQRCWVTTVKYEVDGQTYTTNRESLDALTTLCSANPPPGALSMPGEYTEIWYDTRRPDIAIRLKVIPWMHLGAGIFSSVLAALFFIYLARTLASG